MHKDRKYYNKNSIYENSNYFELIFKQQNYYGHTKFTKDFFEYIYRGDKIYFKEKTKIEKKYIGREKETIKDLFKNKKKQQAKKIIKSFAKTNAFIEKHYNNVKEWNCLMARNAFLAIENTIKELEELFEGESFYSIECDALKDFIEEYGLLYEKKDVVFLHNLNKRLMFEKELRCNELIPEICTKSIGESTDESTRENSQESTNEIFNLTDDNFDNEIFLRIKENYNKFNSLT